ncbi:unnamed protein product [Ilex paraguariensis]|uniref:Uncharacterized protein n=1 Tax=Ilex paraguariensis TaxID=185542 RepID=A0ABC8U9R9_9AQUA
MKIPTKQNTKTVGGWELLSLTISFLHTAQSYDSRIESSQKQIRQIRMSGRKMKDKNSREEDPQNGKLKIQRCPVLLSNSNSNSNSNSCGWGGRRRSLLFQNSPPVLKPGIPRHFPVASICLNRTSIVFAVAGNGIISRVQKQKLERSSSSTFKMASSSPLIDLGRRQLRIRPSPELGLLSLLFVLSTSLARFAASMHKLSKVVSEEVPGTLFSLKLSGLEINDLTLKLSNLSQNISGSPYVREDKKQ